MPRELLSLKAGIKDSVRDDLELWRARYAKLKSETALKTIQFYRLRERAGSGAVSGTA